MKIKSIKIDANGKSKEEIKKELLDQVEKQFEESFKQKEDKKPAKLSVIATEVPDKGGYNVEADAEGCFDELCEMATTCISQMIRTIQEDNPILFLQIMNRAMHLYMEDEEEEKENE